MENTFSSRIVRRWRETTLQVKMFNDLFKIANSLDLYVMSDLHLNNIVMNLTNDRLLLIDTIPEKPSFMARIWKLDFTNKIDDLALEFG